MSTVSESGEKRFVEVLEAMRPWFRESGFVGFSCPTGWLDLVHDLHTRLTGNPDYRVVQVKEKFGGLRFYTEGLTHAEREMVYAAEAESFLVCADCGTRDTVSLRNRRWVASLCDACDANYSTATSTDAGGV